MGLVPYLKWVGVALAVLAVIWVLTRRVAPPFKRLALRCLATSAALMPQPLWAPGDGGAIMPALAMLVGGGAPVFSFAMGAFPIFAGATLLFTLAGWRLARTAEGAQRLAHQVARCWVLVGLILPLLALAVTSPFLAFFLFGGPMAIWGTASLVLLGGAAVLDSRAAPPAPRPWRLWWAAYLLAALIVVALVVVRGRRFVG